MSVSSSGGTLGDADLVRAGLAGIYVFATFWVIKSIEASRTKVDEKATRGEVQAQPHGVSDALRPLPVTPVDVPVQAPGEVR